MVAVNRNCNFTGTDGGLQVLEMVLLKVSPVEIGNKNGSP